MDYSDFMKLLQIFEDFDSDLDNVKKLDSKILRTVKNVH